MQSIEEKRVELFRPQIPIQYIEYLQEKIDPRDKAACFKTLTERYALPSNIAASFEAIPRENFLPEGMPAEFVYAQCTPPVKRTTAGESLSTVSEPEVVAFMTKQLNAKPGDRVLEVGGGSCYQTAILAHQVGNSGIVHAIEFFPDVAEWGSLNLRKSGVYNALVHAGDGSVGLPKYVPYDKIMITASVPPIPPEHFPLFKQLRTGGTLVAPIGGFGDEGYCHMVSIGKDEDGKPYLTEQVPMTDRFTFVSLQGRYGWDSFRASVLFDAAFTNLHDLGWDVEPGEYMDYWFR